MPIGAATYNVTYYSGDYYADGRFPIVSAEVYAWPEVMLYVYPAGGSSAIMAYCEQAQLSVSWAWHKFKNQNTGGFAGRSTFVQTDKDVQLTFGQMFYDNTTFLQANSATAFNANLVFSAQPGGGHPQSAEFAISSAVFTKWGIQTQQGDIVHCPGITMQAADVSGLY